MTLLLIVLFSVVPRGEIVVRGAAPAASDTSTPVPETGRVSGGRYRNAYFGLVYPIPAGWSEQPAGPPPSDGGAYVLAQFATANAHVLVTAQDLFFSARRAADARELLAHVRASLEPQFVVESEPAMLSINGREFVRFAYRAPRSGLRWRVLTTDARCHALMFTFAGTDVAALDAAETAMRGVTLANASPRCVAEYADVVEKREPVFGVNRYKTIPVRLVIGRDGRVKHVHVLSAFADQAQAILAALREWRFKPAKTEIETGVVFGMPRSYSSSRNTAPSRMQVLPRGIDISPPIS